MAGTGRKLLTLLYFFACELFGLDGPCWKVLADKLCLAIYKILFCTYNNVMEFEWDEQKNLANYTKHKVSFELACLIFEDPLHLVKFDRVTAGEERWHAMGSVMGKHVLVVAHTYRNREDEEIIRIISARRASSHERRQYEQG